MPCKQIHIPLLQALAYLYIVRIIMYYTWNEIIVKLSTYVWCPHVTGLYCIQVVDHIEMVDNSNITNK